MPTITDWIMVGITAVYVIATIFISLANMKSAKATREQLTESKRQYEDKKRLEVMPYIQVEYNHDSSRDYHLDLIIESAGSYNGTYTLGLSLNNAGFGAAKDITYSYSWDLCTETADRGFFPVRALIPGERKTILLSFEYSGDSSIKKQSRIDLHYSDLLENKYNQSIEFFQSKDKNKLEFKLLPPEHVVDE